jgi:hypothetical protein
MASFGRVGEQDLTRKRGQPSLIGVGETVRQGHNPTGDVIHEGTSKRPALVGELDVNAPAVLGAGDSPDEATSLGSVDESRDAGLLKAQEVGQLEHAGLSIPQDTQEASLGYR